MKAIKIFTNMLIAGLYSGLLFELLVFYLNGDIRPKGRTLIAAYPALGLSYALAVSLVWGAFLLAGRSLWRGVLEPRWISFRYTIWMLVVNLAALSILFGVNRWAFRRYLPPDLARLLLIATAFLVGLLAFLLYLAIASHPRAHWRHRYGAVLAATVGFGLIWWLRASYQPPPDPPYAGVLPAGMVAPPTLLVGIDSASMDLVVPIAARGQLPILSRILREGASGRLAGLRPARPGALWASLSSGKLPYRHGRYGATRFRVAGTGLDLGLVPYGAPARVLLASRLLRTRPAGSVPAGARDLESILTRLGAAAFVNWKGSPSEAPVYPEGEWTRDTDSGLMLPVPAWDSPGFAMLRERLAAFERLDPDLDPDRQRAHARALRAAVQDDLVTLQEAFHRLEAEPRLFAVRFQGLDRASRVFLRYTLPDAFGNVAAGWRDRYGNVLDAYYRFLDDICGSLFDRLPKEGRLFLVSAHGIEPLGFGARMLARMTDGGAVLGGHHGGPDGIFFVAGPGIGAGVEIEGASILDFVPTLLYSLGLPVGRDMDGRSLVEVFDPVFTREHPVFLIPTYEGANPAPAPAADAAPS